jgi:hypothetical protein
MSSSLEAWVNSSLERQQEYAREGLLVSVTEEIHRVMNKSNVTKADLGRLLGVHRVAIQQTLDGTHSMTLRKLADIARVLGCRVEVKLKKVR